MTPGKSKQVKISKIKVDTRLPLLKYATHRMRAKRTIKRNCRNFSVRPTRSSVTNRTFFINCRTFPATCPGCYGTSRSLPAHAGIAPSTDRTCRHAPPHRRQLSALPRSLPESFRHANTIQKPLYFAVSRQRLGLRQPSAAVDTAKSDRGLSHSKTLRINRLSTNNH